MGKEGKKFTSFLEKNNLEKPVILSKAEYLDKK